MRSNKKSLIESKTVQEIVHDEKKLPLKQKIATFEASRIVKYSKFTATTYAFYIMITLENLKPTLTEGLKIYQPHFDIFQFFRKCSRKPNCRFRILTYSFIKQ